MLMSWRRTSRLRPIAILLRKGITRKWGKRDRGDNHGSHHEHHRRPPSSRVAQSRTDRRDRDGCVPSRRTRWTRLGDSDEVSTRERAPETLTSYYGIVTINRWYRYHKSMVGEGGWPENTATATTSHDARNSRGAKEQADPQLPSLSTMHSDQLD